MSLYPGQDRDRDYLQEEEVLEEDDWEELEEEVGEEHEEEGEWEDGKLFC